MIILNNKKIRTDPQRISLVTPYKDQYNWKHPTKTNTTGKTKV